MWISSGQKFLFISLLVLDLLDVYLNIEKTPYSSKIWRCEIASKDLHPHPLFGPLKCLLHPPQNINYLPILTHKYKQLYNMKCETI